MTINKHNGLTSKEVIEKLKNGRNELLSEKKENIFQKIFHQLNEPMIYILFAAMGISFLIKETTDALIMLSVIVLNTIIGLVQEGKAQKSLESLKRMSNPRATVKRDGILVDVDVAELVPGDLVYFEAGKYIPADLEIIEAVNLKINESALTGESVPVEKRSKNSVSEKSGENDAKAFMSTIVTYGRGSGVVTGTGMNTEIGKIANILNKTKQQVTPLQEKLKELSKFLGIGAAVACIILFCIGILQGREVSHMLITTISLAVAVIPEGLTTVITVVLALGMQQMVKQNAVIRRISAVETLGSVNIICSDKTGTITQNKMRVAKFCFDNKVVPVNKLTKEEHELLIHGFLLCNDASNGKEEIGDPTEIALLNMSSISKKVLNEAYPRIDEIPFESERKLMTTVHEYKSKKVVFTKGATDVLLGRCTSILINGQVYDIKDHIPEIMKNVKELSSEALRVLALAYKEKDDAEYESGLTFVGFVGMIDPPKKEVKEAVAKAQAAGIKVIMITGDHSDTAYAIAKDVGICNEPEQVISGTDLSKMTEDELKEKIDNYRVFSRVLPEHKVSIVKAFQAAGNIVSMTGDGVNDAPALKTANIGVAMGINGSDVSKDAASMILVDDNFSTIVKAVEEGRNIYNNIKKSIYFSLSGNLGEFLSLFFAIILNITAPLRAIHILWINLVTDAIPGLALGMDKKEPNIMQNKPRNKNESLFANGGLSYVIINGVIIGIMTLLAFYYGNRIGGEVYGQSMAFATLGIVQLFHSLNSKNLHGTIFNKNFFKNWLLWASIIGCSVIQVLITQLSFFNEIFKTKPLELTEWLLIGLGAVIIILINELIKSFKIKDEKPKKQKRERRYDEEIDF